MAVAPSRLAVCVLLGAYFGLVAASTASGQGRASPRNAAPGQSSAASAPSATYGPLEAGQEAYQRGEAERRAAIARQLRTLDSMAWYSGLPGLRTPPSLESIYAYPRAWRVTPFGVQPEHPASVDRNDPRWNVFEPWPLVPGDIYGYPQDDRVAQPVGHEVVVTGPNSYVYRPIYPAPAPTRPAGVRPTSQDTVPPPPTAHPPAAPVPARGPSTERRPPGQPSHTLPSRGISPREF